MPRPYTVVDSNVTVSAVCDLLQIKGAANKIVVVKRLWWKNYDNTLATAQNIPTRCRFLPATVTDGNGGSLTPARKSPGDAAASFTCLSHSTSQASTSGTGVTIDGRGEHLYNGYDIEFDDGVEIPPSTSLTFETLAALSGTVHLIYGADCVEYG